MAGVGSAGNGQPDALSHVRGDVGYGLAMVSGMPTPVRRAAALAATVLLSSIGLAATAAATSVERPSELPTVEAAPFPRATNQQLMAYYVNNYRTTRGTPALRPNWALQTAAQRHAGGRNDDRKGRATNRHHAILEGLHRRGNVIPCAGGDRERHQ